MTSEAAKPNRRYLKASLAGGAAGLVTVLLFLLEQRPELAQLLLERVVIAWGPQFVIVLLLFAFLYLLGDRYAPQLRRPPPPPAGSPPPPLDRPPGAPGRAERESQAASARDAFRSPLPSP